ncbi:MAG: glycoside hydrolase N-terminal domain-containing protein [Planctomycetota bacterium]|nr:glycoside hydrolase N-terminal domain-containing protein [Planctomycetota bacterium]
MKESLRNHFRRQALVNERPPPKWIQGIPLGNGDIGAMQWGGPNQIHYTLAKGDFWDLRLDDIDDERFNWPFLKQCIQSENWETFDEVWAQLKGVEDITPTFLPVGRLTLDFDLRGLECSFNERLNLYRAHSERKLRHHQRHMEIRAFASLEPDVLCIRIQNQNLGRALKVGFERKLLSGENDLVEALGYPPLAEVTQDGCVGYVQKIPNSMACAVLIAGYRGDRKVDFEESESGLTNISILSSAPVWLYVVIGSGESRQEALDDATSRMQVAESSTSREIWDGHLQHWEEFWNKSWLSMSDRRLENLWHMELYKLASASQPGSLPCNLQGLWPPDSAVPPWRGNYHFNIKTQQTYWPIYTSNHLELGEPLYDWLLDILPQLNRDTKDMFGFEGACLPTGTDPLGRRIDGWSTVQLWTMAGAWVAQHFWLHYQYTLDHSFLRDKAYPFIKECLRFCEQIWELKDGKYTLAPSHSPELYSELPQAWCADSALDVCLMKQLLTICLEASELLQADLDQTGEWRSILESLPDYPVSSGCLTEWPGSSTHESHRNLSHLAPVFPIGDVNLEGTEADAKLAKQSLADLIQRGHGMWMSWSFPWASCIASRLGQGRKAERMLGLYLEGFVEANSFSTSGDYERKGISALEFCSPTLEAGFGAAAAINEMLLQSWGGKIRLFPGLPHQIDASFHHFRAESAFLISAFREDGELGPVVIESLESAECAIVSPFKSREIIVHCSEESVPFNWRGDEIHFPTVAHQTYIIQEENYTGSFEFQPVGSSTEARGNTFGLKTGKAGWWKAATETLKEKVSVMGNE